MTRADALGPIEALLAKADAFAAAQDRRNAASYYLAAVRGAAQLGSPPELREHVQRAEAYCNAQTEALETAVRARLGNATSRSAHALDLFFGRRRAYFQQPLWFRYPDLPQIQFYDPAQFPWSSGLLAKADAIRAEALAVLAQPNGVVPYLTRRETHLHDKHGLAGNEDWSAFFLWEAGAPVAENAARCPATMAALAELDMPRIPRRGPTALFSILKPGARIPPHHGFVNTRLICHLPLVTPPGCELRVGNEIRSWRDGEILVFDDTIEHEARNQSGEVRVILLFEIWRPELSSLEREEVTALFTAIDDEMGVVTPWQA